MTIITTLSGNEMYCLAKKGFSAGNMVVGNSVYSLGLIRSLGAGFKAVLGGELQQVTKLIEEGREVAYKRMVQEANEQNATGITGVSSGLIFHPGNVEFLSIGSLIFTDNPNRKAQFSTSATGQELYAQLDANYRPICFAFGNVAYSIGLGRSFLGGLKTLVRGEIKEFSDIFNHTRHLALQRIIDNAKKHNSNAVLGIKTLILPFSAANEMLMMGTASHANFMSSGNEVVTSALTNIEMWNLAALGYAPMKLLLGTSVYSLGFFGSMTSFLKSFVRGEIPELTKLIYGARENALDVIKAEAKSIGADDVFGVKTYVYQLGNGLIEFLAIGTAVKKMPELKTESEQLPPQAVTIDQDNFYDFASALTSVDVNRDYKRPAGNIFGGLMLIIVVTILVFWKIFFHN